MRDNTGESRLTRQIRLVLGRSFSVSAQANARPAISTDTNSGPAITLHRGSGVDAVLETVALKPMALRASWHSRRVRRRRGGHARR